MARIRTIKPEFWTDEKLAECSIPARLLFIGSWNFADDEGRMEYSPKRLKFQVFPADNLEIDPLAKELEAQGLVLIYQVGGKSYLQISNFKKHQAISHARPSSLPSPLKDASGIQNTAEVSGEIRSVPETSGAFRPEGNGREGNGGEGSPPALQDDDSAPDGLPALQLARGLIEHIGLPVGPPLMRAVEQSIVSVAKQKQITEAKATDFILARAREAKGRGERVTRFWFEDASYLQSPGKRNDAGPVYPDALEKLKLAREGKSVEGR